MYLYHASTVQNLKTLEPRHRSSPHDDFKVEVIFASPLAAYSACHSFLWETSEGVVLKVENSEINFSIPENFKERLQVPISIYKISDENFMHTNEEVTGQTWHTVQPTDVIEEIKYESVEKALVGLGVKLHFV